MKIFFFTAILFSSASLFSQTTKPLSDPSNVVVSDSAFTQVEVESEFPGGLNAWMRFLQQNLEYPKKAVKKNIQGTVVLQFIVGKDGTVTNISAISGPDELKEAAVKTLMLSPKWVPANQFGKKVKSYKKQPITFRLQ